MGYHTNLFRFKPKNPKVENIFRRLERYPITKIDGKLAQSISRHKKIRYLSRMDKIWISKGRIGLEEGVKIKYTKKGFEFKFKL